MATPDPDNKKGIVNEFTQMEDRQQDSRYKSEMFPRFARESYGGRIRGGGWQFTGRGLKRLILN